MSPKRPLELTDDTPLAFVAAALAEEAAFEPPPTAAAPLATDAASEPAPPADVSGQLRNVSEKDQRVVYMWTWSHTQEPGRPDLLT